MTVVVDIGNSQMKWARVAGDRLVDLSQFAHAPDERLALEAFGAAIRQGPERVVVANVAGDGLLAKLRALVTDQGAEFVAIIAAAEQFGVQCAYADPSRLGADRWVGVIAAHRLISGPACIIDAGTTVTLDAVTRDGKHLGGLIMPGPKLAAAALNRETRGIGATAPAASLPGGLDLLGRSTNDAVAYGTMLGNAAAIDRAIGTVANSLGDRLTVVLTGGGAAALEPWLETEVSLRPHFILEGLAYIASAS